MKLLLHGGLRRAHIGGGELGFDSVDVSSYVAGTSLREVVQDGVYISRGETLAARSMPAEVAERVEAHFDELWVERCWLFTFARSSNEVDDRV